jgi:hypothetical protein
VWQFFAYFPEDSHHLLQNLIGETLRGAASAAGESIARKIRSTIAHVPLV